MTTAHTYQRVSAHSPHVYGQKGKGVIVMESCPITAIGMRNILARHCGFASGVELASNLSEIPLLMRHSPAKLIIMELCGEEESVLDGLRLIALCLENWPAASIIVCTALDNPRVLQLLTASGIKGLVLKQEPTAALAQCVQQVISGHRNYSLKVRQLLASQSSGGKALTARELDVLAHLFSGKSVTAAALMMHRDIRTISTHKRNAMHKLGFHNDGELYLQGKWMAKTGPVFTH